MDALFKSKKKPVTDVLIWVQCFTSYIAAILLNTEHCPLCWRWSSYAKCIHVTQKCRMSSRCMLNIKISLIPRSPFVWEQDYIKICLWSLLTFTTTVYRLCHTLASCPGSLHGRKRWRRNLPALSPWSPESMIPKARAEGRNHLEKFSTPVCMYPTITCTYQSYIILCRLQKYW